MGHRERSRRAHDAVNEGAMAYSAGYDLSECPYKEGEWSLAKWWRLGWTQAQQSPDFEDPVHSHA